MNLSRGEVVFKLPMKRSSVDVRLLSAFVIAGIISSLLAIAPEKSFLRILVFGMGAVAFYHINTNPYWDQQRLLKLLKVLVVLIFLMSVYGIIQYVLLLLKDVSGLSLRVTSVTTHPNAFAKWVLPFIPVCITFALIETERKKSVLYWLMAACMIAALMFTISRGAWIGMAVATLLLMILFRSWKMFLATLALAIVAALLLPPEIGLERLKSIFILKHQWNVERLNVWQASFDMIKDHPLFGIGLNNFQFYYMAYQPAGGIEIFRHAHNTFIHTAVEHGIIGVSLFTAFVAAVAVRVLTRKNFCAHIILAKSIVIGIVALLTFGIVEYNFNNEGQIILFFIKLGIASRLVAPELHHVISRCVR